MNQMHLLVSIYEANKNEPNPMKHLPSETLKTIRDLTFDHKCKYYYDYLEVLEALYDECKEKLGFINQNPPRKMRLDLEIEKVFMQRKVS